MTAVDPRPARPVPARRAPWRRRGLPRRAELALWCVPLLAAWIVRNQARIPLLDVNRLMTALVAVAVVALVYRRPDRALLVLIIGLPFQRFAQAWLFAKGVPFDLLRPAGYWKEVIALGLVVAAIRSFTDRKQPADTLDKVVLGFVGVVLVYAALPHLFAADAPLDMTTRFVGARQIALWAVVFLACRHLPLPAGTARRLATAAIVVACATAAIALYEWAFSDRWNDFVVNTVRLPAWIQATGDSIRDPSDIRIFSGTDTLRTASVFFTLDFATYLLLPLALVLRRALRPNPGGRLVAGAVLLTLALLSTQTRNGIIAGAMIGALTVWSPRRRYDVAPAARARLALLLLAGFVLLLPLLVTSGLAERVQSFFTGEDKTQEEHTNSIDRGFTHLVTTPLGNGLGTSVGAGQRFGTVVVSADNGYLYVGNEVGLFALVLYAIFVVALVPNRLGRTRDGPDAPEADALRSALIAIGIASFVMQPWVDIAVSWTFWVLAGVVLAVAPRTTEPDAITTGAARRFGAR